MIMLPVAFLAGIATFFSPCILPVIPGYLSILSSGNRSNVIRRVLLFCIGIILFFTTVGVVIGWIGQTVLIARDLLSFLLGVILVVFGIHLIRPLPLAVLGREFSLKVRSEEMSDFGAFLLGGAFGIAWTPCSGVILGAILAQALILNTFFAAPLLLSFAIGIAVPMVAAAAIYQRFGQFVKIPSYISRWYNPVIGVVVLILGLSILTGWINYWRADLLGIFPNLERGLVPFSR